MKGMEGVLKTLNPQKISEAMDKFEKQFEDTEVAMSTVGQSMVSAKTLS